MQSERLASNLFSVCMNDIVEAVGMSNFMRVCMNNDQVLPYRNMLMI